jgi:hypothetical protein
MKSSSDTEQLFWDTLTLNKETKWGAGCVTGLGLATMLLKDPRICGDTLYVETGAIKMGDGRFLATLYCTTPEHLPHGGIAISKEMALSIATLFLLVT